MSSELDIPLERRYQNYTMSQIFFLLLTLLLFQPACSELEQEGPEGSVNVAPSVIARGQYTSQQNSCRNDGSELTIVQDLTTLFLKGGFDYLSSSPDEFEGHIDENGDIIFSLEEGETSLNCTAKLVDEVLAGTCTGTESCNFIFKRKTE